MKEDWLKKIKERMSNFEIDEPSGIWDALEQSIQTANEEEAPVTTEEESASRRSYSTIWARRFTAAAAVIAVIAFIGMYLKEDKPALTIAPVKTTSEIFSTQESPENNLTASMTASPVKTSPQISVPDGNLPLDSALREENQEIEEKSVESPIAIPEPQSAKSDSIRSLASGKDDSRHQNERRSYIFRDNKSSTQKRQISSAMRPGNSRGNSFSVSLYGSGGIGINQNHEIGDYTAMAPPGRDPDKEPFEPVKPEKPDFKLPGELHHKLPVRVVAGLTYNINDRIGIETGLSYVNLVSEFEDGLASERVVGKQRLHYLGIPLNIKYRIYTWKILDFYASGGGMWEKCISAKIHKEYPYNSTKTDENLNIGEKPTQWSVNAAAGIQCNLISRAGSGFHAMSVFVEPGVSYYFDDGTPIETIYKDKPFNFNLNLGVRLSFGN